MTICLIRPPILVPKWNQATLLTPPIGLAYVAGTLRGAGHPVRVIDALGEGIDRIEAHQRDCFIYGLPLAEIVELIPDDARIIGVSAAFSFEWLLSRDLISQIRWRFPNALIVGGGEHITAMPEVALLSSELDVAILGEGEETALALADAENLSTSDFAEIRGIAFKSDDGIIRRNERRDRMRELDAIPWPAWDLLPVDNYLEGGHGFGVTRGRSMPVLASRGCPYQCTFCSSPGMWTTRWVVRSVDNLVTELAHLQAEYGATNFDFYDLTAIVKKKWIVEFCEEVLRRDMGFTWQLPSGTRSEAIDGEVADLLYRSGCRNLSYAPESGSPTVLTRIKKRIVPGRMVASMRASVVAGLNVKCNIMLGFPGETYGDVLKTYVFIARMALAGAHDLSIWAFSPYPGSAIFDDLCASGDLEINDNYFDSLRSYADAAHTVSYSENISNRSLRVLRTVGLLIFYSLSLGLRPLRAYNMIRNILSARPESRSEMAILGILRRQRPSRAQ